MSGTGFEGREGEGGGRRKERVEEVTDEEGRGGDRRGRRRERARGLRETEGKNGRIGEGLRRNKKDTKGRRRSRKERRNEKREIFTVQGRTRSNVGMKEGGELCITGDAPERERESIGGGGGEREGYMNGGIKNEHHSLSEH